MKFYLLLISVFLAVSGSAQKQMKELYNLNDPGMKRSGWHFSPGLTYMFPSAFSEMNSTENTGINEEIKASGRLGLYAEVGRHHLFDQLYFLDHLDYGLAYKRLTGTQQVNIICETCDAVNQSRDFKDNFGSAYVNFSNIWQISDYNFIQNGFGINADYRISLNASSGSDELTALPENSYAPDPFQLQLHYKFSFGMKAEKGTFIIPSVEIPILNTVPFANGRSTLQYFGSGYRPIIFSIKFMFLSERKPGECVGSSNGKTGHQLWGKKQRR